MLFRRRKQADFYERVLIWFWPRRSFSRSLRYMGKRVLRIPSTPHAIALGFSVGVFFAHTPFYGLHILLAVMASWTFSASITAAAIGTTFANPLTIPLIFSISRMLGQIALDTITERSFPPTLLVFLNSWNNYEGWSFFLQLLIGSILLGGCVCILSYALVFTAIIRFRAQRCAHLANCRHTIDIESFNKKQESVL